VLAVHGAGAGGFEFDLWAPVFAARGYQLIAPDLKPNPAGLRFTELGDYLEQIRACADEFRPRALIGASLGGLIAATLALELDLPAVLINAMPPKPFADGLPRKSWPEIMLWADRHDLKASRRALGKVDAVTAMWAARRWRDESGLVLNQASAGIDLPGDQLDALHLISELDLDVPAKLSQKFAQAFGMDQMLLRGCTHVEPLLGKAAASHARVALAWLEARLGG
jgi:alpha-beta hydrolase superfamily lysophospholipase